MTELLRYPRSFGHLVITEGEHRGTPMLVLRHEGKPDVVAMTAAEVHRLLAAIFGSEVLRPPKVEEELPRLRTWMRTGQWEAAGEEAMRAKTHGRRT